MRRAYIHVIADIHALKPPAFSILLLQLLETRDNLRKAGYSVECEPSVIGSREALQVS